MSQSLWLRLGRILIALSLILTFSGSYAWAQEQSSSLLQLQKGHFRLSLESVEMPSPDDRMGLLGFSCLAEVTPAWYLGVGGYGSVSGDRGGFFTGGFSGGIKQRLIENIWLDAGLFVGGGGGGGAAQGGGLIVRPHAGLVYDFDSVRVGAAFSWIDFPNGDIESRQLALTLDIPFSFFRAPNPSAVPSINAADVSAASDKGFSVIDQEVLVKSRTYTLSDSTRTTSGTTPDRHLNLIGVEFRRFLTRRSFLLAETMGAFGGDADGYAEVLFGAGYRMPLTRNGGFSLLGTLAAGGAGGGEIDTGGGTVIRAGTELEYRLSPATFAALNGGYIDAVDGTTSGWILGIKFGLSIGTISAGPGGTPLASNDLLGWSHWRVRSSLLSYQQPERLMASSPDQDVHLVGVKLDHFVQENIYVTGQAAGAYRGEAGGYAVGLIGLGWQSPRLGNSGWRLVGELLAGAGGGGGLAVGEGALVQPMLGIEYSINDRFGLQAMAGQTIAVNCDLNTTNMELSLCVRFANLVRIKQ